MVLMKLRTVGKNTTETCFLSVNHIQAFMISICLIIGFITLDHLVIVVSAGFLYCRAAIFPFVINIFEAIQILFLFKLLPISVRIRWWIFVSNKLDDGRTQ